MSVTLRKRRRAERSLAHARILARDDARALALEIGRGVPTGDFDAMDAGIVLGPEETAYRQVLTWLYVQERGTWFAPTRMPVLITDERVLCQTAEEGLAGLPWRGIAGLRVDLCREHVVLDYGDGHPLSLAGTATPVLAVAAVAFVYGVEALLVHPALEQLRRSSTGPRDT